VSEIKAFIEARYAEREAVAKAATEGEWHWVDPGGKVKQALVAGTWDRQHGWRTVLPSANGDVYPSCFDAEHIALNNPQFVLADIAAKRRIVALYEDACDRVRNPVSADARTAARVAQFELEAVLRLLTAPFASHPDYDPAWAS
jgi:hypothetical protein